MAVTIKDASGVTQNMATIPGSTGGVAEQLDQVGLATIVAGVTTPVGSSNPVPITASSLPIPTGAATATLQGAGLPAALGAGGGIKIDGSGTPLPVSASALPLPALAATSTKQPALGTAGAPSADVISTQGVAGGVPMSIDARGGRTLLFAPVNLSALGNGVVAAAVTGKRLYVYSYVLVAASAVSVEWIDTNSVALSGAMPLAANGGVSANVPCPSALMATSSGFGLNLNLSAAVQVSGHIAYWAE